MIKPFLSGLEQQMASMRSQAYQPSGLAAAPVAAPEPAAYSSYLAAEAEAAGAPALAAAEEEIEAAIAEGMIEEAEAATGAQRGKVQQGKLPVTGDERLTAELEVKAAFERLSAKDGVREHDALVQALEAVSPHGSNGVASSSGRVAGGAEGDATAEIKAERD